MAESVVSSVGASVVATRESTVGVTNGSTKGTIPSLQPTSDRMSNAAMMRAATWNESATHVVEEGSLRIIRCVSVS